MRNTAHQPTFWVNFSRTHRAPGKTLATALMIGSIVFSGATLTGCSSSADRQAKYLERAQTALDSGDFDKARVDLKNVLQINASNARARLLFAKLEERQQNWPQMYANLSAAVEADPNLFEARIKLAELLIAGNQLDKAQEQIDKVLEKDANNVDAMAAQAGLLFRQKKIDEATAVAEKILTIKPGQVTATGLLAAIYGGNDPDKAETFLNEGIRLNPDNTTLQMLRIQILARQKKTDEVISAYQKLIQQKPDAVIFSAQLANFYISQKRDDDAEKTLRDAVAKQPDKDEAKLLLVEFLAKNKKPEDAKTTLEQFSAASPDNYKLRTALVRLYGALGDVDKATSTLQYTIDKDPRSTDSIDARNRLIELALATQKREQADKLIKEVLKLEPENGEALLTRARLAMIDNDANATIADLRTVLKNTPDAVPALELFAAAQERIGANNLALDNYQKLLQINPNNLAALVGAARLQVAQNQLDDAQKKLEQARKIAPDSIEVTRQLVELYSRREQWQPALDLSNTLLINQQTAPVGFYLNGLVNARKKDFPAAIDAMKKSLTKEPRAIEPLQTLVNLYLVTKQTDTAVAYLEQHTKDHPDQTHAQEFLATLYRQTGKFDQAEKLLNPILEKDPKRISAYREMVAVYAAKGQRERIEPLLQDGLKKDPGNTGLMLLLAEMYQSTGKNQLALDNYNKLEKLLPQSPAIKNNLAALLIEKFPTEENLKRAQALTSDFSTSENPVYIDTLGWLHYKLKNYPQSISLLEDAVHKRPLPELQYHLGMAYLRNNMAGKAKEQLAKATENPAKFPGRDEAESELKKL